MEDKKSNSDSLKNFLANLAKQHKLSIGDREWWPQYIYHSSDINDVVSILSSGFVYSRSLANRKNLISVDIASSEVLDFTPNHIMDYARFYFRPKTPTQYLNEGIRKSDEIQIEAHCPIPVYLLFDATEVLLLEDTKFSDRNLASYSKIVSTIPELMKFPFNMIYHQGSFPPSRRDEIISHRNAEVIVKDKLSTEHLKLMYCRSEAEKDTLFSLMDSESFHRWSDYIKVDTKRQFFHKKWTFIRKLNTYGDRITIAFSPETESPGPFIISAKLYNSENEEIENFISKPIPCNKNYLIRFKEERAEYKIQVYLDDILAFQGQYVEFDLPF